MDYSEIMH